MLQKASLRKMEPNAMNIPLEKLSPETQRLIKGLEILKQKLDKTSEQETAEDNKECGNEDHTFT